MTARKKDEDCKPGSVRMRAWRANNLEKDKAYQRAYKRAWRQEVYDHYGSLCVCCGETQFEFLSLDHIEGGGNAHRAEVGGGSKMIAWIRKNNFPEGFQILCHNCNQAKGFYGGCPHRKDVLGDIL